VLGVELIIELFSPSDGHTYGVHTAYGVLLILTTAELAFDSGLLNTLGARRWLSFPKYINLLLVMVVDAGPLIIRRWQQMVFFAAISSSDLGCCTAIDGLSEACSIFPLPHRSRTRGILLWSASRGGTA
jgi:hypothetical protein